MAKRSTDLLEVFHGKRSSGKARSGRSPRGGKGQTSGRKLTDFDGLFLTPRQLLLVSCVLVLLIVLAFTAGLGIGKRGAGDGEQGPALQRQARPNGRPAGWYIWAAVSRWHQGTLRRVDPADIVEDLGIPREFVHVEGKPGAEKPYDVYVGPWDTRDEARAYLERNKLGVTDVRGSRPFNLAKIRKN